MFGETETSRLHGIREDCILTAPLADDRIDRHGTSQRRAMDVEFRNPKLDQLEVDPAFTGGFDAAIVRAYRLRMQLIRGAKDERDFYAMKSLHYEKLKGKRA